MIKKLETILSNYLTGFYESPFLSNEFTKCTLIITKEYFIKAKDFNSEAELKYFYSHSKYLNLYVLDGFLIFPFVQAVQTAGCGIDIYTEKSPDLLLECLDGFLLGWDYWLIQHKNS